MADSGLQSQVEARLQWATGVIREAGQITLDYFSRSDLKVDRKQDNSPVTVADREAEVFLRAEIERAFPDDAVAGEEFKEQDHEGTSGFSWILDPIDGTKSFIHRIPLYSNLIGIQFERKSVAGLIRIPAMDEMVYAADNFGSWYQSGDGEPVRAAVSETSQLSEAMFITSEIEGFCQKGKSAVLDRLAEKTWISRTWGDGYGYLMVATGRADIMVDPAMEIWDAAPLLPILREAGGTFTDWQGRESIESGNGFATNGRLFDQVLSVLGEE
jgi:histidinol-phosphatase